MSRLESRIKEHAHTLGFELAGIASAQPADGFAHLQDWLDKGYAGEMAYMANHADARGHPRSILPTVRSIVMVGVNYKQPADNAPPTANSGRISCYAGGRDYHEVMRDKLKALLTWIQAQVPGTRGRAVIDTAPLLERDYARRAGLGWFGKNTMLIDKKLGSYCFLGALLLDLDLQPDAPFETAHCGTCTRCLDACPTDAFVAPYQLDARRCISYLTIELRGAIDENLRADMGDWIFGCDVCQEVCPWNRKSPLGEETLFRLPSPHRGRRAGGEGAAPLEGTLSLGNAASDSPTDFGVAPSPPAPLPRWGEGRPAHRVDLLDLLDISEDDFRSRYRHTPIWRTRRSGLRRNSAIALGNVGDANALPALRRAADDADDLVRDAARWALAQIEQRLGVSAPPAGGS